MIAFTTNAPSTPNDAIDTAARSGPNAIADCDAVDSTPLAAASRSSATMRGGRAWNAGSENALVIPSTAPDTMSAENDPASRNSNATPAASVSAIDDHALGSPPVDRDAGDRAEQHCGQRPREPEQREVRRTRVEAEAREAPQGDERAPAPDRVDGLAEREQREATVAEQGHASTVPTGAP